MDSAQLKALAAFIDTHAGYIADWLQSYNAGEDHPPGPPVPDALQVDDTAALEYPTDVRQVIVPQFKPGQQVTVSYLYTTSQQEEARHGVIIEVRGAPEKPTIIVQEMPPSPQDCPIVAIWMLDRWYLPEFEGVYQVCIEPTV